MAKQKPNVSQPAVPKAAASSPEARSSTKDREGTSSLAPAMESAAAPAFSYEQIAERAYQIYLQRGFRPGDAVSDWLEAERQLKISL
ncbi:MAG: DUF2934 domain-containing protein [Phycisphaerae bacterium]